MVRHHIAEGTGLFILDVVPIPYRFEQRIAEAENEDILDGLFAKVVVNPVYRFLLKYAVHHVIEYVRRFQVSPEGFFQNNSRPSMVAPVQSNCSQTLNDRRRY